MTKHELDSLIVVRGDELEESGIPTGTVELWNCSGLVGTFPNRDAAYTEVLRLRGFIRCPLCERPARIGAHDSAYCGACFLSFRASDPRSSLPMNAR